jgi:hypothetical protein
MDINISQYIISNEFIIFKNGSEYPYIVSFNSGFYFPT